MANAAATWCWDEALPIRLAEKLITWPVLDASFSFVKRALHLGYRQARLAADHPLGTEGTALRGHEFHYVTLNANGDPPFAFVSDAHGAETSKRKAARGDM